MTATIGATVGLREYFLNCGAVQPKVGKVGSQGSYGGCATLSA